MKQFFSRISFARLGRIALFFFLIFLVTDIVMRATRQSFFPFGSFRNSRGRTDFSEYVLDFLPREKGAKPRVFLIGDSTILGLNRRYDQTLGYFLGKGLDTVPALKGVDVINMAMGASTPADGYLLAELLRDFEGDLAIIVSNHCMYRDSAENLVSYPQLFLRQKPGVLAHEDVKTIGASWRWPARLEAVFHRRVSDVWFFYRARNMYKRWWLESRVSRSIAVAFKMEQVQPKKNPSWQERLAAGDLSQYELHAMLGFAGKDLNSAGPYHRQYRFLRRSAKALAETKEHAVGYANPVCMELFDYVDPSRKSSGNAFRVVSGFLSAFREGGIEARDYTHAVSSSGKYADLNHLLEGGNSELADAMVADVRKIFAKDGGR